MKLIYTIIIIAFSAESLRNFQKQIINFLIGQIALIM